MEFLEWYENHEIIHVYIYIYEVLTQMIIMYYHMCFNGEDQVHKFQVRFRQCHCGLWSFFSLKCRGMKIAGKWLGISERWMRSLNVENDSGHQDMRMWFWLSLLDLTWMRLRSPSLNFVLFTLYSNSQAQIQHSWVHIRWREGKAWRTCRQSHAYLTFAHKVTKHDLNMTKLKNILKLISRHWTGIFRIMLPHRLVLLLQGPP